MCKFTLCLILSLFGSLANGWAANFSLGDFEFSGKSLDIHGGEPNARTTFWKPDGTVLYLAERFNQRVRAYRVATPWDIETATYLNEFYFSNELGTGAQTGSVAHGLFFRDDGMKMWVWNRREIWAYTLSTPWDITTASSTNYGDYTSFTGQAHGIFFRADGTRFFIDDRNERAVFQVNYRGSSGFGGDYQGESNLRAYEYGPRDVIDGVRWLIDKGEVDESRIGIYGWSFGAYITMACSAMVVPTIGWKCAKNGTCAGHSRQREFTWKPSRTSGEFTACRTKVNVSNISNACGHLLKM